MDLPLYFSRKGPDLERSSEDAPNTTRHKGCSPLTQLAQAPQAGGPVACAKKTPGRPDRAHPDPAFLSTCSPCAPGRCRLGDPAPTRSERHRGARRSLSAVDTTRMLSSA